MHLRILPIAFLAAFYASSAAAAGWSLITKEEFSRDQAAPHVIEKSLSIAPAGAPGIEVEQPDPAKPIKSPVTIKIRFQAQDGAIIDPSSIRITYGWLQLDITKRVLEHAVVTADGITATDAAHNVTMKISDRKGRVATKTFAFTVL